MNEFLLSSTSENILPVSIGVGLWNDEYSILFRKGTIYPAKIKQQYFTTEDDQGILSMAIYLGEQNPANKNTEILNFVIPNLPPSVAGEVNVDVTFELDNNGFLNVTGKAQTSIVRASADYQTIWRRNEQNEKMEEKSENGFLKLLIRRLTQKPDNYKRKEILKGARTELKNFIDDKERSARYNKNITRNKKKVILSNCDEVLEWLDEHPDETLNESIVDLVKMIHKNVKDLPQTKEYKAVKNRLNPMSCEDFPEDEKKFFDERYSMLRPDNLSYLSLSESESEYSRVFSSGSNISDNEEPKNLYEENSSSDAGAAADVAVNTIQLKEEFNEFAIIIKEKSLASPEKIDRWIDLSDAPPNEYLNSFSVNDFFDLITLFLTEIQQDTVYKYPCLAILVKWVLNLRRPFFDFHGFDHFGKSTITPVFENEVANNPNDELLLAINRLKMPMI